jgi:hypothetical protein
MERPSAGAVRVGVVFVHGIGEQKESESVRWFGNALFKWLTLWYQARSDGARRPQVISSALSYGAELEGPSRFTILVPATGDSDPDNTDQEWLIAEAFWADRISPPSFQAMVQWAGQSTALVLRRLNRELEATLELVLARIRRGITTRETQAERLEPHTGPEPRSAQKEAWSDPGLLSAVFELLSGVLLAVLYLLSLVVLPIILILLFLASLIPVEAWRKFVMVELIETFLVKGIGDFQTFIEDDVQANHIRRGLADNIEWLATTGLCEDIIVVAHSHGAVVAFDALTTPGFPGIRRVRKLLTVGGALNNAWHLYGRDPRYPRLRRTLPSHIHWVDFWSYYDPVAGSRLRPPVGSTIVDPTPELQNEMRWYRRFVDPDFTPEVKDWNPEAKPDGPLPRQVTNGMNVLRDHDGYFRNPEQFLSRLACEIDRPRQHYGKSRFRSPHEKRLSYLRRTRVSTLVSWRLYAIASFLASVAAIVVREGADDLAGTGAFIGSWADRIPGAEVLRAPGTLVDGIRKLIETLAAGSQSPWRADSLNAIAALLALPFWGLARDFVIAVVAIGLVFLAAHVILTRLVYDPWDKREAESSVRDDVPRRSPVDVYGRGAIVLAVFALLAVAVVGM